MQINALNPHRPASEVLPENLAGNRNLTEREKVAEASRHFEAILVRQILESATKPVIKSKFSDNSTTASIYHDMMTTHLADSISKSGALGLAQTFEQQLNRPAASGSKAGSGETPNVSRAAHHASAVRPDSHAAASPAPGLSGQALRPLKCATLPATHE